MTVRTVPFEERRRPVLVEPPRRKKKAVEVLGPDGQPARLPPNARCPQCGATADKRVLGGMGTSPMICGACGYEVAS